MNGSEQRRRWAVVLMVVLVSVVVGLVGYNVGPSQGLAQTGVATDGHFYGWHRPWAFGFVFPFLFLALWFGLFRGLWWRWGGPGPRRHRYYAGWDAPHPAFDEWHRRAHERMKESPPADDPGRRG